MAARRRDPPWAAVLVLLLVTRVTDAEKLTARGRRWLQVRPTFASCGDVVGRTFEYLEPVVLSLMLESRRTTAHEAEHDSICSSLYS